MQGAYLIVGLGNPGKQYDETRHNIGFDALDALISKHSVKMQKKSKVYGDVGFADVDGCRVIFLKPTTYMNLSGKAVKACADYYKVSAKQVVVIVDDVDIPLGEIRLKFCGGAGTHNGLKSIEHELNSKSYVRLKIGIGTNKIINLEEFVLNKFLPSEKEAVKSMLQKTLDAIDILLTEGIEKAMSFANIRMKKHLGESQ